MIIRQASLWELPCIARFYRNNLPKGLVYSNMRRETTVQSLVLGVLVGLRIFCVELDDRIVAATMVWIGWVGPTVVAQDFRHNGLGSTMLSYLKANYSRLRLCCSPDRSPFYLANGFRVNKIEMVFYEEVG